MKTSAKELRLRRLLAKQDLRLQKTPARHWSREWYGAGYMVVDDRNCVVIGATHRPWDASLDEVEALVA